MTNRPEVPTGLCSANKAREQGRGGTPGRGTRAGPVSGLRGGSTGTPGEDRRRGRLGSVGLHGVWESLGCCLGEGNGESLKARQKLHLHFSIMLGQEWREKARKGQDMRENT